LSVLVHVTFIHIIHYIWMIIHNMRGRCGLDRMVVGFITIYAISAYHH